MGQREDGDEDEVPHGNHRTRKEIEVHVADKQPCRLWHPTHGGWEHCGPYTCEAAGRAMGLLSPKSRPCHVPYPGKGGTAHLHGRTPCHLDSSVLFGMLSSLHPL
ncbi:hypothetical protein AAC387_Pa01g2788 [Persea americana]